jgi:nucleotide-binding universal stress UspA family protein
LASGSQSYASTDATTDEIREERTMPIARILVATDFSDASRAALRYAEMLATHDGSELHLLHVVPDARRESWAREAAGLDLDDLTEDWIRDAECKLQRIASQLPATLDVRTATRVGLVPDEILAYVEACTIDLVVIGGAADARIVGWLGTGLAERVARRAPCPVLTVPDCLHGSAMPAAAPAQVTPGASSAVAAIRTILIAVDFNRHAVEALIYGLALAENLGAAVHVLHVYSPPWVRDAGYVPPPAELTSEVLRRVEQTLAADVSRYQTGQLDVRTVVRVGKPVTEILRYAAESEAGLIVVGTHGRENVGRLLLGSVAEAMLRRAPCPVLTLHAGVRGARSAG